jgi:hypothetical protein
MGRFFSRAHAELYQENKYLLVSALVPLGCCPPFLPFIGIFAEVLAGNALEGAGCGSRDFFDFILESHD